MNKERLLNVARAVREADPEKFTMERELHSCGTPACAFGQYAARQDLQSAFVIGVHPFWDSIAIRTSESGPNAIWWDSDEVREHFDISEAEARLLFFADGCGGAQTPTEAAEFIEQFVRERE